MKRTSRDVEGVALTWGPPAWTLSAGSLTDRPDAPKAEVDCFTACSDGNRTWYLEREGVKVAVLAASFEQPRAGAQASWHQGNHCTKRLDHSAPERVVEAYPGGHPPRHLLGELGFRCSSRPRRSEPQGARSTASRARSSPERGRSAEVTRVSATPHHPASGRRPTFSVGPFTQEPRRIDYTRVHSQGWEAD